MHPTMALMLFDVMEDERRRSRERRRRATRPKAPSQKPVRRNPLATLMALARLRVSPAKG